MKEITETCTQCGAEYTYATAATFEDLFGWKSQSVCDDCYERHFRELDNKQEAERRSTNAPI